MACARSQCPGSLNVPKGQRTLNVPGPRTSSLTVEKASGWMPLRASVRQPVAPGRRHKKLPEHAFFSPDRSLEGEKTGITD
ncbi:Hypothetical protein SMAX5B_009147 [Scophthalmus maximus]|uniref:Uncharacterized protein n=1 Tax=Scophthalmus maximus TaxID=52904 RepID=A0A2U9CIY7_SCOMX|nr:Hypothetical protein SMAX5B_009147 [Scophthalmus maximus]